MKTSIKSRAIALAVAIVVTFGMLDGIADYAYPLAPMVALASTV